MPKINTNPEAISEILNRGTITQFLPTKQEFEQALLSGKQLKFYIGFDATGPTLHLSHAKNFLLLEKFRQLGHEVIILFGDFTARIGDPTGKDSARKQLTREEVLSHVKIWKKLVEPLMNFQAEINPPQIKYNHDWLSKLTFEDVISLASNFTVQQMLDRDMFQKRLQEQKPIHLHEFFYPLMQGYDSVAMNVDVELCGTDQIFNALAGRTLQKKLNEKEKFVIAVTLMENPKTGELMSKSKGTGVFLDVSANDLYGQIMSQPDEMTKILFTHCTHLPLQTINQICEEQSPRNAKMRLAYEITKLIHNEKTAKLAQDYFIKVIQQKQAPDEIPTFKSPNKEIDLIELLTITGLAQSKSEARRLVVQKGIKIESQTIEEPIKLTIPISGLIIQKGKRHFLRIIT